MSEFISLDEIKWSGLYEMDDFCTYYIPYNGRYLCDECGECGE